MKKIYYTIIALTILLGASCTDIDNYDGPNAGMKGKLIDKVTGKNFIAGQGEFSIRLWEMSWSDNPTPQNIPIKQDGTFSDSKLFAATYDMQPFGGPFWPVKKETDIKLSGTLEKDFEVTPYLYVIDVTSTLEGTNLKLTCKLKAPITENLPRVMEVKPFVSLTQYCGEGSRIEEYNKDQYRVEINKTWAEGLGDMTTGEGSEVYTLPDLPLKSGRTYYVRVGVKVEDTYRKYNYCDIIKVVVP